MLSLTHLSDAAITGLSEKAEAGIGWLSTAKEPGDASAFSLAGKFGV